MKNNWHRALAAAAIGCGAALIGCTPAPEAGPPPGATTETPEMSVELGEATGEATTPPTGEAPAEESAPQ